MKYLKKLLNSKAPKNSILLDIAIVLSVLPHLLVMKSFMIIYLIIALLFILKKSKKKSDSTFLMLIGLVLIGLSFFTSYNFSNFSRMQFFVSFISSLLIYALTLQKLTQEINIYYKLSPILLLVLSFFFFNSLTMLFYSIATLFIFTLLHVWSRMNVELLEVIKFTAKLFIASLPLVTLLFLVFPRISIEKSNFGFRADKYLISGYDGKMNISAKELKMSQRIIMEVLFNDANIDESKLYFRGSTLTQQKGVEWSKSNFIPQKEKLIQTKEKIKYEVTIYPHANYWVYALDIPTKTPKKVKYSSDLSLKSYKAIYQKKKFLLESALSYKLLSQDLRGTLSVDIQQSDRTYKAIESIRLEKITQKEKAKKLMQFFALQQLAYTLRPTQTDTNDTTDSFLFDTKNGYCVHFASAFANSARMLNIPSRVVTGFKAKRKNMVKNYLIVKASDAHAWVELYFKDEGWVRFDPTEVGLQTANTLELNKKENFFGSSIFREINHYFMYTKYLINNWILDYNRSKQMEILDKLLHDTLYLLKFIGSFILFVILIFILFITIKNKNCKDKLMCEMEKLLKNLKKLGYTKPIHYSMHKFLQETQESLNLSLLKVDKLYHSLKYKKEYKESELKELQLEIKKVYEESKSSKLS